MRSFMFKRASAITRPVIILVSEAMGTTAVSFLRSNTCWVFWSMTRATVEFSDGGGSRRAMTSGSGSATGPDARDGANDAVGSTGPATKGVAGVVAGARGWETSAATVACDAGVVASGVDGSLDSGATLTLVVRDCTSPEADADAEVCGKVLARGATRCLAEKSAAPAAAG